MKLLLQSMFIFFVTTSLQTPKEKLELRLSKGSTYVQVITSNGTIVQTINGNAMEIKMSIVGKMSYKVTDIQDMVYNMEVRYDSLVMRMKLPTASAEFSSEKRDDRDVVSSLLGAMKSKPFLIKMTRAGKVLEVKNIDSIFSGAFDKFTHISAQQKKQILDQVMQAYGEKAFKGNMEMNSAIFPEVPVSQGDQWTISSLLESGMSAKVESVYELKNVATAYYQIVGNSTLKTADKDAYIESNGMKMKMDLSGSMTSDIKIDRLTGWIQSAVIYQNLAGNTFVKDSPQMPGGMIIPMTMKNVMTVSN
jgi:hypothetical protein